MRVRICTSHELRRAGATSKGTVAFTPAINWWGFLSAYLHSIQIIFSGFPAHPQHAPISTPANSVYLFRHRTFCPILSRRAGGCSVAFGAWVLFGMVQCKCCAENYSTRSRWPGSNRHRPQFCFRAALPLSYSGICAAGKKTRTPPL